MNASPTAAAATAAEVRLMLHRCGLSQTDAADYLGREARLVRRWISGDYAIPAEHWQRLGELCARQDRAAREAIAKLKEMVADHGDPREVTLRLARSQADADRLGWPCPGAHVAVLRRVVEWAPPGLRIVPVHPGDDVAADAAADVRHTAARR